MKTIVKDRVLDIGINMLLTKGYNGVGLNEILKEAQIPKGSFYHYFQSKEDFGLQVIQRYSEHSIEFMETFLMDASKSPKERLLYFFSEVKHLYIQKQFMGGCLLGNTANEMSDTNLAMCTLVDKEFGKWEERFETCIQEAIDLGEISGNKSAKDLAAFIFNSWEGAILRMKASKSIDPITLFNTFLKSELLT